jgi:hypothetical protein
LKTRERQLFSADRYFVGSTPAGGWRNRPPPPSGPACWPLEGGEALFERWRWGRATPCAAIQERNVTRRPAVVEMPVGIVEVEVEVVEVLVAVVAVVAFGEEE